jgi:hypothetical protein
VISEETTTSLSDAKTPRLAQKFAQSHVLKLGCVSLLCCGAALLAGCSSDPLQPPGALWTGTSNARADTAHQDAVSRKGAYKAGASSAGGWGSYSGRRGQTSPPPLQTYAFKGDPNANGTFAPGPGQVQ